jgi:hypothetical protein
MLSQSQKDDLLWQRDWYLQDPDDSGTTREESGAEVPVPDRLFPKRKSQALLYRLKLSQKIGLLLWMNRSGYLSRGGEQRFLYLQRKASIEAIQAGLRFSVRISAELKLQRDFYPHMVELNRRPQSSHYRKSEKSRIGVGYRDKGTLPDNSTQARSSTQRDSWILLSDLPENLQLILTSTVPQLIEEGWLDLGAISDYFDNLEDLRDQLLLNQL